MAASSALVADEAEQFLVRAAVGPGLAPVPAALIGYGTAICATSLDLAAAEKYARQALEAGADEGLLIEVLVLVSAVGVHALHEGVIALGLSSRTSDAELGRQMRHRYEGDSDYWRRLDAELPGFLGNLAANAPWAYEAFIEFVGAAARDGRLNALLRELIWAAIDATPTHRYVPGLRLHLSNAVDLGATRDQISQTLAIAAAAPAHVGIAGHRAPSHGGKAGRQFH